MSSNQNIKGQLVFPKEGDLLFEMKSESRYSTRNFLNVGIALLLFAFFYAVISQEKIKDDIFENLLVSGFGLYLIGSILFFWYSFRSTFNNGVVRGFYFKDKIIFHYFWKGKWLPDYLKRESTSLSTGRNEPHVIELSFSKINYFLNDKEVVDERYLRRDSPLTSSNRIRLVETVKKEEETFYQELKLAPAYKKYASEIVAFLNDRVKACKAAEI